MELADFEKMEQIRARVDAIVDDPTTAEALKPWYRQFCKRPCFHDEYLPTFNRPNVTLVDTDGKGVERITETGVVADGERVRARLPDLRHRLRGRHRLHRRAGYETVGRDGMTLSREVGGRHRDRCTASTSHGFPNCFIIGITQTRLHRQLPAHAQRAGAAHRLPSCAHDADSGADEVEVDAARPRTRGWTSWSDGAASSAEFLEACTPGYYNNEGHLSDTTGLRASLYGAGSEAFFQIIRNWREAGDLDGLEVS